MMISFPTTSRSCTRALLLIELAQQPKDSSAPKAKARPAASLLRLLLQDLGHLHVDVEELGSAAVEADALALVQIALAVVVGHALLGAGLGETADATYISSLLRWPLGQ